jgi:hypothetical protein
MYSSCTKGGMLPRFYLLVLVFTFFVPACAVSPPKLDPNVATNNQREQYVLTNERWSKMVAAAEVNWSGTVPGKPIDVMNALLHHISRKSFSASNIWVNGSEYNSISRIRSSKAFTLVTYQKMSCERAGVGSTEVWRELCPNGKTVVFYHVDPQAFAVPSVNGDRPSVEISPQVLKRIDQSDLKVVTDRLRLNFEDGNSLYPQIEMQHFPMPPYGNNLRAKYNRGYIEYYVEILSEFEKRSGSDRVPNILTFQYFEVLN